MTIEKHYRRREVENRMRRLRPIDFARFRWVMRLREGLL